jgi:hypothetical protein
MGRVASCFARRETRLTCRDMVNCFLMELEDYNCWTIAEAAGHLGRHRMQHLPSRASVDDGQMLDTTAAWAAGHLAGDAVDTVLIVDETGGSEVVRRLRRASPPVQRHDRGYRDVPGPGHPHLCVPGRARPGRPGPVPCPRTWRPTRSATSLYEALTVSISPVMMLLFA